MRKIAMCKFLKTIPNLIKKPMFMFCLTPTLAGANYLILSNANAVKFRFKSYMIFI